MRKQTLLCILVSSVALIGCGNYGVNRVAEENSVGSVMEFIYRERLIDQSNFDSLDAMFLVHPHSFYSQIPFIEIGSIYVDALGAKRPQNLWIEGVDWQYDNDIYSLWLTPVITTVPTHLGPAEIHFVGDHVRLPIPVFDPEHYLAQDTIQRSTTSLSNARFANIGQHVDSVFMSVNGPDSTRVNLRSFLGRMHLADTDSITIDASFLRFAQPSDTIEVLVRRVHFDKVKTQRNYQVGFLNLRYYTYKLVVE